MEPRHSLSECLRRRHASLMNRMAKNPKRDEFIACAEEILSIEYWLRITEQAERETRMSRFYQTMAQEIQGYEERLLTMTG